MRIKWLLYTLLASSIIFVSCYDDPVDQRDPQVKPTDEFLGDNTIIGSIRGCADLEVEDITLYVKTPITPLSSVEAYIARWRRSSRSFSSTTAWRMATISCYISSTRARMVATRITSASVVSVVAYR